VSDECAKCGHAWTCRCQPQKSIARGEFVAAVKRALSCPARNHLAGPPMDDLAFWGKPARYVLPSGKEVLGRSVSQCRRLRAMGATRV
jgi:hypothetical protein